LTRNRKFSVSCQRYQHARKVCKEEQGHLVMDKYAELTFLSSKGMFLYARIVLDNLEQSHGIDEIRRELEALPTDLADA
jgi:hypothetical protein